MKMKLGREGVRISSAPPGSVNDFSAIFGKFWLNNRLAPPFWGYLPSEKYWIRRGIMILKFRLRNPVDHVFKEEELIAVNKLFLS